MIDIIGYIAACLTTFSFLPQAIKTIKSRDTSGISLIMYSMFVFGVFMWFLYGLLKSDYAVMIANFFTMILAGSILSIKIKAIRKPKIR